MSKKDTFDDFIRKRITSVQQEHASDWTGFEQKLDSSTEAHDVPFDEEIKNILNTTTPTFTHDWSLFEDQLIDSEQNSANTDFDVSMKNAVQSNPLNHVGHWPMFSEWLDFESWYKRRLYVGKISEVVIMLLIFWFVGFNAQDFMRVLEQNEQVSIPMADVSDVAQNPIAKNSSDVEAQKKNTSIVSIHDAVEKANARPHEPIASLYGRVHQNEPSASGGSNNEIQTSAIHNVQPTHQPMVVPADRRIAHDNSSNAKTSIEKEQSYRTHLMQDPVDKTSNNAVSSIAYVENKATEALSLAELNAFEQAILNLDANVHEMPLAPIKTAFGANLKGSKFLKANFVSKIANIKSPYDRFYDIKGYYATNMGAGFGVNVGTYLGRKVAIETGLQFHNLSYAPREVVEYFRTEPSEYNAERLSLNQIKYLFVEIPLLFTWNFGGPNKWNFYANAGMNARLNAYADYKEERTLVDLREEGDINTSTAFFTIGERSIFDSKPFNPGAFNGGSFRDNLTLSMQFGAGFNYLIQNRLMFFFEPSISFNVFLNEIGPNSDRINYGNLALGFYFNL